MKSKKRGSLEEHMVDIVIAVICLLVVAFVAYAIYNNIVNDDYKKAKITVDSLEAKINALKVGQQNQFIISGFKNADEWILIGWSKNQEGRPQKCFFNSCLCVCKSTQVKASMLSRSNDCQQNGICRLFDYEKVEMPTDDLVLIEALKEYKLTMGNYMTEAGAKENVPDTDYQFIRLEKNLIEVQIVKNNEGISITRTV